MAARKNSGMALGLFMMAAFAVVLVLMFSNIFPSLSGQKVNGLDWADDMFNSLSKGSSYFIPDVRARTAKFKDQTFNVTVKVKKPEAAAAVFAKAGCQAVAKDGSVTVNGSFGDIADKVLGASEQMFNNDSKAVEAEYGMDGPTVLASFHQVLQPSIKELQKNRQVEMASAVDLILRKGIEPAYNYYGVQAQNIMDKLGMSAGLLIFYVVYTMWYGFAIVYILQGLGLSMSKPKVKAEV
jgi:cytochrome c551/c552